MKQREVSRGQLAYQFARAGCMSSAKGAKGSTGTLLARIAGSRSRGVAAASADMSE
jgi:hypothetical protein